MMTKRTIHLPHGAISAIRKVLFLMAGIALFVMNTSAQFAPVVGYPGTTAIAWDSSAFTGWATGCTIYRGYRDIAVPDSGYASVGDSGAAIGMATQNGVVSLGDSGVAILTFARPIVDGSGFDFAVFENGFDAGGNGLAFLELAFVEVSSDGQRYVRFPTTDNVQDTLQIGLGGMDGSMLNNLAGKYIYGYGTPFDLAELIDSPGLDVNNINYVKIIDVIGTISPTYATHDSRGHIINDPYPTNYASSGFDLDAVGVIHAQIGTGISTSDPEIAIKVFPNPMQHFLNITIAEDHPCHLSLIDMTGRDVVQETVKGEVRIDMSAMPSGLYEVRLLNEKGSFTKTIVKE